MTADRTRKIRWVGALLLALLLIIAVVVVARWRSRSRTIAPRAGIEGASGDDAGSPTPEGADGDSRAPTG